MTIRDKTNTPTYMPIVRNAEEVLGRIEEVEDRLKTIEQAIQAELQRPFFTRRRNTCQFLDLEKKRYTAALLHLKWIIYE